MVAPDGYYPVINILPAEVIGSRYFAKGIYANDDQVGSRLKFWTARSG